MDRRGTQESEVTTMTSISTKTAAAAATTNHAAVTTGRENLDGPLVPHPPVSDAENVPDGSKGDK